MEGEIMFHIGNPIDWIRPIKLDQIYLGKVMNHIVILKGWFIAIMIMKGWILARSPPIGRVIPVLLQV